MGTRGAEPVDISSLPPLPPLALIDPQPMLAMLQSPFMVAVTVNSCGATRRSALCAVVVINELFGSALKGCTNLLLPRLTATAAAAAAAPALAAAAAGPGPEPLSASASSTFFSSRCPPSSSAIILANGPVRGLQCKLRTPTVTCGPPQPTTLAGLRYECGRHV